MPVYEADDEMRNQTGKDVKYFVLFDNFKNVRVFKDKKSAEAFDKKINGFKVGDIVMTYEQVPAKVIKITTNWVRVRYTQSKGNLKKGEWNDYDPRDIVRKK
jgi:hypothetical protein